MFAPQNKYSTPSAIGDDWLRLVRSHSQFCETDEPEKTGVVFGIPAVSRFVSRYRLRARNWRSVANSRCAGRERRSRDEQLVALARSRSTHHASARKCINVRVGSGETIRECLQEDYDLVLLLIRQAEIPGGHIDIVGLSLPKSPFSLKLLHLQSRDR